VEDLAQWFPVFVISGAGPEVVGGVAGFPEAVLVFDRHLHVALMGSAHGWMVRVRSCWSRTIGRVSDWISGPIFGLWFWI
jgi:hypothetical protein